MRASDSDGSSLVVDGDTIRYAPAEGFRGQASIVFEVTDGETLTDPEGRTTVVSIPVQVGPETPVLHCPTEPLGVVQGGSIVTVDVTAVCHVWVADPDIRPGLRFSATWSFPQTWRGGSGMSYLNSVSARRLLATV